MAAWHGSIRIETPTDEVFRAQAYGNHLHLWTLMAVETPTQLHEAAKTNTVIITSLTAPYFHPRVQAALRHHFEYFGRIHTWAPLTGLGRIMVVFWDDEAAEGAKSLDGTVIGEDGQSVHSTLRVFRALPTPLAALADQSRNHLAPPPMEKNFLISPPGSPPVGWEQIQEDPPNAAPLAEDLLAALERLELNYGSNPREDGRAELIRADDVDGGIGVWVEDAEISSQLQTPILEEHSHEGEWYNPQLPRVVPRTARPPMPA